MSEDKQLDIKDDTYDAVTISAGFVKGHLPLTALDEAIRICKPGRFLPSFRKLCARNCNTVKISDHSY